MTAPMELQVTTVRGEVDRPRLLVVAGVHGDEFEPMVAVKRLGRLLRKLHLRGSVTLIPVLNHSAWERKQRTGADGLDLARTFPGRADGTITEQVAFAANEHIRRADFLIDLHTGGKRLRLWPLAGYLLHPNAQVLERQREMARAFNLPVVWGTDPSLDGRTLSAARDVNVPAIYVEYLGAAPFCRTAVHALTDGCLQVMAKLGMIDSPLAESKVRFWAEDGRPGAGHLQVCQPAPHAGIFEAAVELGEPVEQGQVIGKLEDSVSDRITAIFAEQSGRVVCLAAPLAVEPGHGLAVIARFENV